MQILASCAQQSVAHAGDAAACDLLVSIGGDGTALAAIRAGAAAARPVLAVTCGSLGVLTSVPAGAVVGALERFSGGGWAPWHLPALEIEPEGGAVGFALNDIAIVRGGGGQIRLAVHIDGNLVARLAGDGCVVSTPLGSSGYALAAGGPLLPPDMPASLFTPLLAHGGSCPPVVVGASSAIRLDVTGGHGGARLELDGQVADTLAAPLTVRFRSPAATLVTFPEQQPLIAVLRDRQIITDSPRFLAEDARGQRAVAGQHTSRQIRGSKEPPTRPILARETPRQRPGRDPRRSATYLHASERSRHRGRRHDLRAPGLSVRDLTDKVSGGLAYLDGVLTQTAMVFEHALADVQAGRAGRFGAVIGVDRVGLPDALRANGANVVVGDLPDLP